MNTYRVTDYGVTPDSGALQTKAIQSILDRCRAGGGKVVFPCGTYVIGSLRLWSDTTLLLESGAILLGSEDCNDYEVYPVPAHVVLRTDIEVLRDYYTKPLPYYRRAMLSAYGERNIAILGEAGSMIDGRNCYDPDGEEGYRGPHGIFLTNCENIILQGYTIGHAGNFMHQLDNCVNTVMRNVTNLGGSDGIHLHFCTTTLIEDCIFHTGDDCIAGIGICHLLVRRCELNTACQIFRMGGNHIRVENCRMWGPGVYPHRMTIVKSRDEILPREAGRHNTISMFLYFGTDHVLCPDAGDIAFENCTVEGIDNLIWYRYGDPLQMGAPLCDLTLCNVIVTELEAPLMLRGCAEHPFKLKFSNVSISFREGVEATKLAPWPMEHVVVME